ncbi:hypothetical protein ACGJWK_001792 [Klebsiella aerogenes]|nr:hypothetical protein [Salmonella enterica]EBA9709806.1 hypothetical protein [Salmonella enterica]EKW1127932.1 hypothetical protein [Klebsiella aerogenes]EKW1132178.1 hypothetical protein [Klebsiella aerogenes]ELN6910118.1 hypothetical protein [Salmonella enterica]
MQYKLEVKMNNLDPNNIDRLQALISLKRRCLYWEEMSKHHTIGTFFSDFSDEIDLPLLFIMNDELTNSNHRIGITELINSCVKNNKYYHYLELKHGDNSTALIEKDLNDIYVWQADKLIHMLLTRFFINIFSVFEYWTCKAYDAIKNKHASKNTKLKKLEERLLRYVELTQTGNTDALDELKMEIFTKTNSYVSSREKIDFILSKITYTGLSDKTQRSKATELVHFLFSLRNTIHNIGINKSGNDYSIEINNTKVELKNNCGPTFYNYAKFIDSLHLLIDLYCDLFMYLGDECPEFHQVVNEF